MVHKVKLHCFSNLSILIPDSQALLHSLLFIFLLQFLISRHNPAEQRVFLCIPVIIKIYIITGKKMLKWGMSCKFGDVLMQKKKKIMVSFCLTWIYLQFSWALRLHHANCVSVSMFLCMFICMYSVNLLMEAVRWYLIKTLNSPRDLTVDIQIYEMADTFLSLYVKIKDESTP